MSSAARRECHTCPTRQVGDRIDIRRLVWIFLAVDVSHSWRRKVGQVCERAALSANITSQSLADLFTRVPKQLIGSGPHGRTTAAELVQALVDVQWEASTVEL